MSTVTEKVAFITDETMFEQSSTRPRTPVKRYLACLLSFIIWIALFTTKPVLPWIPNCKNKSTTSHTLNYTHRAYEILEKNPLIDSHVDFPTLVRELFHNDIYAKNFTEPFEHGGLIGHVDLPRLNAGRYGGVFWSLWVTCPADPLDFSDEAHYPLVKSTLDTIDIHHRLAAKYPHYFTPQGSAAAALEAFHSPNRKFISPSGVEGLHQIGNSFATLRLYYQLGARYATLNHNCQNAYADPAALQQPDYSIIKAKPYWGGLSKQGRKIVREMNRMGMIVDLSHTSQDTMREVLSGKHNNDAPHSEYVSEAEAAGWTGSIAPPFFSHSSVYALCPHPRNVPDDVLQLVKQRGSVVMINFAPDFVSCVASDSPSGIPDFYPANSTLEFVAKHIMYVGNLIGYDHVGLGTDFDGIMSTPRGLEDVSKIPNLIAELLSQGVSEEDVIKVAGGNVIRVWSEVDKVAARMQAEGVLPAED